jgi:hypothetical protein
MSEMKWQWFLFLVLAAIAPFLYANVQGYWALLLVPAAQFFSVAGHVQFAILLIIMNLLGALIVASLLSLPLGYVAKSRPYFFGALLSLAPIVFMLWLLIEDGWNVPGLLGVVRIAEYLSIVIAFASMARLGAYLRTLKQDVA